MESFLLNLCKATISKSDHEIIRIDCLKNCKSYLALSRYSAQHAGEVVYKINKIRIFICIFRFFRENQADDG